MQSKFVGKSTTVQGLILAVVPAIATLFGIAWGEEDTAQLNMIIGSIVTIIGSIWAFRGRLKAKQGLRFSVMEK